MSKRRSVSGPVRSWRSRGPLSLLLAGVVVTGVLQAVPAQAAPADAGLPVSKAEQVSDDPVPVPSGEAAPAPVSPSLEPTPQPAPPPALPPSDEPVHPVVRGDRAEAAAKSAALAAAARTGKPVEIAPDTSETSISYAQPDGTVKVEASAGPARTKVDGDWVPVDTTLQFTGDGVQPKAVTGDITFSDGDAGSPMAVLGDGEDTSLKLDWNGDLPKPVLDGSTATYRNVLPQVDLVLTATRLGFTQHVVVNQRPSASTLKALSKLQFPLDSTGAEVTQTAGGSLEVKDGADVVGTASAPIMWDARTDPASGGPAVTKDVGMDLAAATTPGTDSTLVLTPPSAFLTDPATVYPVTIDPTSTLDDLGDTYVQNNIANTPQGGSADLLVGSYNGGAQVDRSLLRFDVGPAIDSVVQNATLSMYEYGSFSCTPTWVDVHDAGYFEPATVKWSNQPPIGQLVGNAYVAKGYSGSCAAGWVDFTLTNWLSFFADRRNGKGDLMALAITASNEKDNNGWKRFYSGDTNLYPQLNFTYDGNCDQIYGVFLCGAVRDKYYSLTDAVAGELGNPTTNTANLANGGTFNHFQGGSIYSSPATGAHVIYDDAIRDKWASLGWEGGYLGYPTTDEDCSLRDGGCLVKFQGGWIYASNNSPPSVVKGGTLTKYGQLGWEGSALGYPITDEVCGLKDSGCYNHFQHGSLYGSPATGVHLVTGGIRDKWAALGWENSYLGYPTTDQTCGLRGDPSGCYNHFQNGSIYGSQSTGVHDVRLEIRNPWSAAGWEAGFLGFPTSDTQAVAGGWRQEFEGGSIVFDTAAGTSTYGAGTLKNPTQFQRVTQARTQLKATVKLRSGGATYDRVKFQWRDYGLSLNGGWTDIDATQDLQTTSNGTVAPLAGTTAWLPVKNETVDGAAGTASDLLTWNATSTIPDDGLKQVRSCLHVAGSTATDGSETRCSGATQITVDRAGLTGANATADAGPGTVGLLTGTYAVTGRDADITAPFGGLAATRSFASNAPGRPGPLGPGWSLSLAVDEAGADYQSLTDRTDSVLITRGDGTQLPFLRESTTNPNNYLAEGEESTSGWTLTYFPGAGSGAGATAASYVLKDIDGDKVTFRRADGSIGHPATVTEALATPFRVQKIEAIRGKSAAGDQTPAVTAISYTPAGNPRWLLAPTDAGATCPDPSTTTAPAGCRALQFGYSTVNGTERLDSIKLWATGATAPVTATGLVTGDTPVTAQQIPLASYSYDGNGRLTGVTDPRTGQTVAYTYRPDGRLATITPVGATATWTLGYDPRPLPRLISAKLTDATSSGLTAQTTSIRYGLGLDGSTDGLPSFTTDTVKRWGQSVTPTDLTAVFDPATVPSSDLSVTPTAAQWQGATLYALDVNGRTVNTANYGGTVDQDTGADQDAAWRISTTEYDPDGRGNVIRSLTPGNRERALAAGSTGNADITQSHLLDTVNVYSTDGKDLLRSYAPARPVTNAAGALVSARTRTTTTYDDPASHPNVIGNLHLPVTTTVDAVAITSALPAGTTGTEDPNTRNPRDLDSLDGQSRTTALDYGTDNAWILGTATATHVIPGGGAPEIVTRTAIDDQGRTISSTLPAGGTDTTTAATTKTVYYSAANTDPDCKSEAWAGWLCKTLPGGNPSAGFTVPTSWVKAYDVYGNATRTLETGQGSITRTSDTAYDAAGRARRTSTTGAGTDVGTARPITETTYTAAGLVDQTRLINPDGTPTGAAAQGTGAIQRAYDAYGRLASYTDGSGLETIQTYDSIGRAKETRNSQGTRTITYDENNERGSLPTSIAVSDVGTFTARYGADGTLVRESLPGNLTAVTKTDAAGDPSTLTYTKTNTDGSTSQWLKSTATMTGFDQVGSYRLTTATGATGAVDRTTRYGYDGIGRLTTATDGTTVDGNGIPTGATCTRIYAFDANSNRTSLTQNGAAGACPTSVANDAYGYDSADRLQPTGARGTLRYDALGRTRTLPAVDTADGSADVAIDYYADDLVKTLTQGTKTTAFGLDASSRRTVRTDSGASNPTVSYYAGDDDNPDVVKETDNSYTRDIAGFGGLEAIVTRAGTAGAKAMLQLANLHGDIAATVPVTATAASEMTVSETTEYGEARTQPATGSTPGRYGWLGSKQRDASTPGGLTLMGVRLYTANLGRFLSVDPVAGGGANDYEYATGDPVNKIDLDGNLPRWAKKTLKWASHHKLDIAMTALTFVPGVGEVALAGRVAMAGARAASLVSKARAVVQANKFVGASSRLFGNYSLGAKAAGLLNKKGLAGGLRIGWNVKMYNGAARATFRVRVPQLPINNGHITLFRGSWL